MTIKEVKNMGPGFMCESCGKCFQYMPIMMPAGRPKPILNRPGFMDVGTVNMCIECAKKSIPILEEKIKNGEMFAVQVWIKDTDGSYILEEAKYITNEGEVLANDIFPNAEKVGE